MGVSLQRLTPDRVQLENLIHIARNMRQADRQEIQATRWTGPDGLDGEKLAKELQHFSPYAFLAFLDAEPVAVCGGIEMWPGLWSVFMFATDRWEKVALSVTRHVRREMIPYVSLQGARRLECRSISNHPSAHAWLRSLGFELEAVLPLYGRDGQTFLMFTCYPGIAGRESEQDGVESGESAPEAATLSPLAAPVRQPRAVLV